MAVPFRIRWAEWVAGAFVVVAGVTLVVGLLVLARARGSLSEHATYDVLLTDGYGIVAGAPVEMLGIEVGRVESVDITEDARVRVRFEVLGAHASRIRGDSVVRVQMSLGLQTMLGGVGLAVTPGTPDAAIVPPGSTVPALEPDGIADLLPHIARDSAVEDLRVLVRTARLLAERVEDPDSDLHRLVADVSALVAELRAGRGTAGRLLQDDAALYDKIDATLTQAEQTLARVEELTSRGKTLLAKVDGVVEDSDDLVAKADGLVGDADVLVAKAEDMVVVADAVFEDFGPVVGEAGEAMTKLDAAVVLFAEATRELTELMTQMSVVVAEMHEITRATKKVWPIRRHLDDKRKR